jgi:membrane protease YdiL (CAAX protease family)
MAPMDVPLETGGMRSILPYLGAGIYEEAIFRLCLFGLFFGLLRWLDLPGVAACLFAAVASSILFSAAHHLGPYGQDYTHTLFVFRALAGLYFAFLYHLRGFGIVVGAHACYNVAISVGV